jgi:hypothetical protein
MLDIWQPAETLAATLKLPVAVPAITAPDENEKINTAATLARRLLILIIKNDF